MTGSAVLEIGPLGEAEAELGEEVLNSQAVMSVENSFGLLHMDDRDMACVVLPDLDCEAQLLDANITEDTQSSPGLRAFQSRTDLPGSSDWACSQSSKACPSSLPRLS